jgi:hypothetical protein
MKDLKLTSDTYYKLWDDGHKKHMESLDKIISLEKELDESKFGPNYRTCGPIIPIRSIPELIKENYGGMNNKIRLSKIETDLLDLQIKIESFRLISDEYIYSDTLDHVQMCLNEALKGLGAFPFEPKEDNEDGI